MFFAALARDSRAVPAGIWVSICWHALDVEIKEIPTLEVKVVFGNLKTAPTLSVPSAALTEPYCEIIVPFPENTLLVVGASNRPQK